MRNMPIKFLAPLAALFLTSNLFSMGQADGSQGFDQFSQQSDQCEKPRIKNPPQCDITCDDVQVKFWLCVNGKSTYHFKTEYNWIIKKWQKNGEEFDIPTPGKTPAEKKDCPDWIDNDQCDQMDQQAGHGQYYDLGLQTYSNLENKTKVVERSRTEDATAYFEFIRSVCEPYSYETDTQTKCLGQCDTAQKEQWAAQCSFGSEIDFMNEVIESYKNEEFDWDTEMSEQMRNKISAMFENDFGYMGDCAPSECFDKSEKCSKSAKSDIEQDICDDNFEQGFDEDQDFSGKIDFEQEEPKKTKRKSKKPKKVSKKL